MSRTFIPQAVRERVAAEARHRCGYCQTQQAVVGMPLHSVHIPIVYFSIRGSLYGHQPPVS